MAKLQPCFGMLVALGLHLGVSIVVAAATTQPARPDAPGHTLVIPQFNTPAEFAGDLSQAPWTTAARITGFLKVNTRHVATHPTHLYACYDRTSLWLAFRCEGIDGRAAKVEATERDGRVWWDDGVEFYCSPDQSRRHFFQFAANSAGVVYDGKDSQGTWNAKWQVASSTDEKGFTIAMRIPFGQMKARPPKPGDAWKVNFARHGPLSGATTWAWCYNGLHDPRQFGTLVFAGPALQPARLAKANPAVIGENVIRLDDMAGRTCRIIGRDRSGAVMFDMSAQPRGNEFVYPIDDDRVRSVETMIAAGDQILVRSWSDVHTPELVSRFADWKQRFEIMNRVASRLPAQDQPEAKRLIDAAQPRLAEAQQIVENKSSYSADRWRELEAILDGFDHDLGEISNYARTIEHFPSASFAVGLESPMRRVMIKDFPFQGWFAKEARLCLARNEREAIQLAVMPWRRDLKNVRVQASFSSAATGLSCSVSLVGHVDVDDDPPYETQYKAFYPDPLLSFLQQADVRAGEHVSFWVDVASTSQTPAGEYRGVIQITADNCAPMSIPLVANVWDFALPDGTHLRNAFTYDRNSISGFYKDRWNETLARAYEDIVLDHRLGIDHLYRKQPPDLQTLERAVARGMNAFNIVFAGSGGMKKHVSEALDSFVPAVRKKGELLKLAYVYGFDEIKAEKFPEARELFDEVHRRAPGIPTMTTAQDTSFGKETGLRKAVDIWVPLTPSYDLPEAEELRREGKQMWWYICLVPTHPYANWFIEYPAIESRLLMGAMSYKYQVDGFLYYLINNGWERNKQPISSGPYTNWDPASCPNSKKKWANGDGNLIYPGPDRPLSSIRLENIRDGLEDYEYLYLLAERVERVSKRPASPERTQFLHQARALLVVPDSVVRSVVEYTDDPAPLTEWRNAVARLICQDD